MGGKGPVIRLWRRIRVRELFARDMAHGAGRQPKCDRPAVPPWIDLDRALLQRGRRLDQLGQVVCLVRVVLLALVVHSGVHALWGGAWRARGWVGRQGRGM